MLPVKRIVLFKHGVGYFEREGRIEGDTAIELQFKAAEMNDVLKSLTALDLDGGAISSISYESTKPTARLLEEVAIELPDVNVLTSLLSQIKGASVSFTLADKKREGEVVGTETFERHAGDKTWTEDHIIVLTSAGELQNYPLLEMESLMLQDQKIQGDLRYLLETLLASKRADQKKMSIFAKGDGSRRVHVSYIIETPVWKTSYRILIEKEEKPLLQGWALIDNMQEEDWNDVQVSLVAGLPVSFVHDLYNMRYQKRPVVAVSEEAPYAPPILEEEAPFVEMQMAAVTDMAMPAAALSRGQAKRAALRQKLEVETTKREAGEMYEYAIKNPVTVRRGQSALVPILAESVEGNRVAVFNESIREKNPMAALELRNSTGTTLESGPVTVFEDGNYVGEAMLPTLIGEAKQLVPFAVELGCVVALDHRSKTLPVHMVRIANGVLYLHHAVLHISIYGIQNKSTRDLDLILEHPFRHGWELSETPEPAERTENYYRFRMQIPAGAKQEFTVTEKGKEHRSITVSGIAADQIRELVSSNYLDAKSQHSLNEIIELQNRITDLDRNMNLLRQNIQNMFKNQERLRQNLQALGQRQEETELRQKYIKQLSEEEDRVAELSRKADALQQEKNTVEQIRADKIQKLSYSASL